VFYVCELMNVTTRECSVVMFSVAFCLRFCLCVCDAVTVILNRREITRRHHVQVKKFGHQCKKSGSNSV